MNPFFQQVVSKTTEIFLKDKMQKELPDDHLEQVIFEWKKFFHDFAFMIFGSASASFGLKGFLLPNHFVDGGVTGISLITQEITGISLSILLILINMPFLLLGSSTISRSFAVKSIIAIMMLALLVHFIPYPTVTDDKLLISVFGGFFLGLGIGLAMRGGAVIDGTEVLAIYLSKKTSLTIGDIILLFNVIIFSVGAYVFSIEISLYAMLTYLAASKTVDFVVSGIEEYVGVTIISEKSEEIRLAIIENLGRGCTIYNGKKGFAARGVKLAETDIVYTLLTRLELPGLQDQVMRIDPKAFMVMHSIKDAKGGMIKKRPLK
ncbi:YitT family protein [Persicobacter diffluens]|uniref:Membrane protein n=1 Tax=Persicobacter diffluens TaxID=981 RepID=A0AAN4VZ60_9BACT|nr:membrane protein [Persicobacter diffluens]